MQVLTWVFVLFGALEVMNVAVLYGILVAGWGAEAACNRRYGRGLSTPSMHCSTEGSGVSATRALGLP